MTRKGWPYGLNWMIVLFKIIVFFLSCNPTYDSHLEESETRAGCDSLLTIAENLAGSNIHLAWLYLDQANQMIDSLSHAEDYARYLLVKGRVFYYMDDYLNSISHINRAITIYQTYNNEPGIAKAYSWLAPTQVLIGHYPAAIRSSMHSLELYEQLGDQVSQALVMNYMGGIFTSQGNPVKARHYLERALIISQDTPNTLLHANVLAAMGRLLMAENDPDAAEIFFWEAHKIRLQCAEIRHIASSLTDLAELYIFQERYDEAKIILLETEQIYTQLKEKTGLFSIYILLGELCVKSGNVNLARQYVEMAHAIAQEVNSKRHLAESTRMLSLLHQISNNTIAALKYYQQYHEYSKQMLTTENVKLFESIEQYHELQQKTKDNEILMQKNMINKQQNMIMLLLIIALVVAMITGFLLLTFKNKNLKNRQTILEKEKSIALAKNQIQLQEKQLLENDLELKNKELTAKTIEMLHQVEILQGLADKIEKLKNAGNNQEVDEILNELASKTRENVWDEFHAAFNNVHNDFYNNLLKSCPELTSTEIRVAALLRLNLSSKEIAAISYKSESAVKTARHRLRQKLLLDHDDNLINFLMKI